MELEFWEQRWQDNQIGFHLSDINSYLIAHWHTLNLSPGSQVFVPLCGKTLDMVWLTSQSFKILGIECSQLAVEAFFNENKIDFVVQKDHRFNRYCSDNITILQGDYFDLESADLINVSAIYDRASLVALPEAIREKYAHKLVTVTPEHIQIILITLEYDQAMMSGPPFSVTESTVQKLYASNFEIEQLQRLDIIDDQARFKERGLDYMIETVYHLKNYNQA